MCRGTCLGLALYIQSGTFRAGEEREGQEEEEGVGMAVYVVRDEKEKMSESLAVTSFMHSKCSHGEKCLEQA